MDLCEIPADLGPNAAGAVLAALADGVLLTDADGLITYVNPAGAGLLGAPPAELLGRSVCDLSWLSGSGHGPAGPPADLPFAAVLAGGPRVDDVGLHFSRPDGERRMAVFSVSPLVGPGPRPAGLVIAFHDQTDRRPDWAAAAGEPPEGIQVPFDAAPVAMVEVDRDGTVRRWNVAAQRLFGWRAGEAVGRPPAWVTPDQLQEYYALRERVLAGEVVQNVEVRLARRDGSVACLALSMAPVRDRQGEVVGSIHLLADISRRKQAEAALRASETRLRAIFEQAGVAILTIDDQHKISAFNPAAERLFGYAAAEIIGQPAGRLVPDWHLPGLELPPAGTTSEVRRGGVREVVGVRRDGTRFAAELNVSEMAIDGQRAYSWVLRDLTNRRVAEAARQDSEERFRRIMEAVGEGIVVQSADGAVIACNAAAEQALGLTAEQLGGRAPVDPRWRVVREDGEPLPSESYPPLVTLRTGEPIEKLVLGIHRPDGSLAWLSITSQPMFRPSAPAPYAVVTSFSDITEQKRAQDQLTLLSLVASETDNAVAILDADFRAEWVNASYCRLAGYSAEELIGRRPSELLAGAGTDPAALAAIRSSVEQRQPFRGELRQYRRDGTPYWVSLSVTPIVDEQNQVRRLITIANDITTRQEAQEALRRSEERFAKVFRNSPVMTAISTIDDGRLLDINEAFERTLGYAREEAVGRTSFELNLWVDPEARARMIELLRAQGSVHEFELRLRARQGEVRDVLASLETIEIDGEHYLLWLSYDVTARKRTEIRLHDTLLELELQYRDAEQARSEARAVLDATSEAMLFVSPERRILSINRRFTDFFGVLPEQVVGRPFWEFKGLVERTFANAERLIGRVAGSAADEQSVFTTPLVQVWPAERELELFSTPVRSTDNHHLGRLYVYRDVTRERQVDRMKTEFVSLVSHELRTPLTSIKGYVDLMLEGEAGEVTQEQSEFLEIVRNNTDRLVALINDLLDIARIESGKVELQREPVSLGDIVQTIARTLRSQIARKSQTLIVEVPEALPNVLGDAARLAQIVTNLAANAHKYTPVGGRVTLRLAQEARWTRLEVADTGIGLTEAERSQLFDKFFRAHNRTTQEVGGTGLGLPIVHSLVLLHGGQIEVASEPGRGSTFTVRLPIAPAAELARRQASGRAHGALVLVVDDDVPVANLIRRYLERAGQRVEVATTAAEALAKARSLRPDIITLDVALPDADGFTALERLKQQPETATIPVLLLSVLADDGRGRRLGAVDYLSKPVDEAALVERVRILAGGSGPQAVLIADGDTDFRRLIAAQLARAGYRCVVAADGSGALARVRSQRPDLVLLNLDLPELDGISVLRALRADTQTCDLPVLIMTGDTVALDNDRRVIEGLGVSGLLVKPLSAEDLAQAIAAVLARGA